MFLCHPLRAEGGAEEDVEEQSGVDLCLLGELIISFDDHKLLAQSSHVFYHLERETHAKITESTVQ